MRADEVKDLSLASLKEVFNSGIGLLRTDLAFTELAVNRLPVTQGKPIEQLVTHIPGCNGSIEVTKE
jgi:hypothetical protein